jgi:hypothetical protein
MRQRLHEVVGGGAGMRDGNVLQTLRLVVRYYPTVLLLLAQILVGETGGRGAFRCLLLPLYLLLLLLVLLVVLLMKFLWLLL